MAPKLTGNEPQIGGDKQSDFSTGDEPSLGGERRFDQQIWLRLIDPRWPHKETLVAAMSEASCNFYARLLVKILPDGFSYSETTADGALSYRYNAGQRAAAAFAIGLLGTRIEPDLSDAFVDPMIKQIKRESDDSVRAEIARALGLLGCGRAESALIGAFSDGDWRFRQNVIQALGSIGSEESLDFLWSLYEQGESLNETKSALETIGIVGWRLGGKVRTDSYDRLMLLFLRSDSMHRGAAARALGQLGDQRALDLLVKFSLNGHGDLQSAAVQALGLLSDAEAVPPLIFVLTNADYVIRQDAADALIRIGKPSIGPALAVLRHPDRSVRRAIIEVLGRVMAVEAVNPLIELLGDHDRDVRRAAVNALGMIADVSAVNALIGALNDLDAGVRKEAAMMLGSFRDPKAVGPLCLALWDADMTVRWFAAYTLGVIGDPRAIQPLIRALGDKSTNVSQAAADSLVRLGDTTVDDLVAFVQCNGDLDGGPIARILNQIGSKRATKALNELG